MVGVNIALSSMLPIPIYLNLQNKKKAINISRKDSDIPMG